MTAPPPPRSHDRRIPCLDGIRAVSISCVIFAHAVHASSAGGWFLYAARLGTLGVHVFFVLSGYLITTLLLQEYEKTNDVSVRGFMWRRITRILPAYAVYLMVVWATVPAPPDARWWPALTYTSNVFGTRWWETGHTWSLSVEEQFYLTWPLIFSLGPRRAGWVALLVFASSPILRAILFLVTHEGALGLSWNHDLIAAGALLAIACPRGFAFRWSAAAPIAAVVVAITLSGSTRWLFATNVAIGISVEAIAIATSLAWCLARPQSRIGRLLDWRPIRALGIVSYSLYLWQQLFLHPQAPLPLWSGVLAALGAATASYWFVERPGLSMRRALPRWYRMLRFNFGRISALEES
jgi:peptidoglycan/LPS O-acetylase OafA/YrhL